MAKKQTEVVNFKDMGDDAKAFLDMPEGEKLKKAAETHLQVLSTLDKDLKPLSKKALKRLLIATLQLPKEKESVEFTDSREITAYKLLQWGLMMKYLLIHNSIRKQITEEKAIESGIMDSEFLDPNDPNYVTKSILKNKGGKNDRKEIK